jgi:hypothetical protein
VHRKRHEDLLRLIRSRMKEAGEWGLRNFAESSYLNLQGKEQPMFIMTKDGYQFLVGRMTGKKAVKLVARRAVSTAVASEPDGAGWWVTDRQVTAKVTAERRSPSTGASKVSARARKPPS